MELNNGETLTHHPNPQTQNPNSFYDDDDDDISNCSTPYVSAPSSPGRGGPISGFFYSAPASPMHLLMTSSSAHSTTQMTEAAASAAAEFEFSARFGSGGSGPTGPMSSADELFLDGKIRPMKLSTHLEQPHPGLIDPENEEGDRRGRDPRVLRSRRTRSMSPMRTMSLVSEIYKNESSPNNNAEVSKNVDDCEKKEELSGGSGASSRSSSAGRNSKRWVFLKEFLHRSKSEGQQRSNANISKLWGTNLFSGSGKETAKKAQKKESLNLGGAKKGKPANGVMGKRRNTPSLHELHYTANRAQSEEMRKKTYLPYRQGLLGCLGFSSKGYGAAINTGFARALNPVSSR